jgi:hypothetical protein
MSIATTKKESPDLALALHHFGRMNYINCSTRSHYRRLSRPGLHARSILPTRTHPKSPWTA